MKFSPFYKRKKLPFDLIAKRNNLIILSISSLEAMLTVAMQSESFYIKLCHLEAALSSVCSDKANNENLTFN